MFEGDLTEGELEIGQVSSLFNDVLTVETIIANLVSEYQETRDRMNSNPFNF
jgi:enoyl-[acyl-carrier protein] reductase II